MLFVSSRQGCGDVGVTSPACCCLTVSQWPGMEFRWRCVCCNSSRSRALCKVTAIRPLFETFEDFATWIWVKLSYKLNSNVSVLTNVSSLWTDPVRAPLRLIKVMTSAPRKGSLWRSTIMLHFTLFKCKWPLLSRHFLLLTLPGGWECLKVVSG